MVDSLDSPDVDEYLNQDAEGMAAKGWKQIGEGVGQSIENQWKQGASQIHQASGPIEDSNTREALLNLGQQAAMSTVGGEAPKSDLINFDEIKPEQFIDQLSKNKRSQFLTPYKPQDLKDYRLFKSKNNVGYALTPTQDIVSVFNNSGIKGAGQDAVIHAIANGGKTLDAFDGHLPEYYNNFGFVEKNRVPWDDQYAPKGWNYEKHGRPDIVYMEFPEHLSRDAKATRDRYELAESERDKIDSGMGQSQNAPQIHTKNNLFDWTSWRPVGASTSGSSNGSVGSNSKLRFASGGSVSPLGSPEVDEYLNSGSATPQSPSPTDQSQSPLDSPEVDQYLSGQSSPYESIGQQAATAVEGLGEGVAGPAFTALELGSGLTTPEAIRGRAEENPTEKAVSKGAGFIGSALLGTGEAALLGKAGEAVAGAAGLADAASLSSKIGAAALKGATEVGLLQSGDELTNKMIQDPNTSSQVAMIDEPMSNIIRAGAIGAIGGGMFGAISPLLGKVAPKLAQTIEDLKGQIHFRANNPEIVPSMAEELGARYNEIKDTYDDLYGVNGLKAKAISEVAPEMHQGIVDQSSKIMDTMNEAIAKMKTKPYSYPERLVGKLQSDVDQYFSQITPSNGVMPTSEQVFNATQDLKQMLQGYSKYGKFIKPIDEAYDFTKATKPLATFLKESLEDSDVWGDAAKVQKAVNENFVKFKPSFDKFEKLFTSEIPDPETGQLVRQVDQGKLQTLVNQAGSFKDGTKKAILNSFVDGADRFAEGINDYVKTPLINNAPMNVTRHVMGDYSPGMKIADILVNQGIGTASAKTAAAATGALGGAHYGQPGWGAMIGEKVLSPLFEKLFPAIAKPLLTSAANVPGLRAAGRYGEALINGDTALTRGTSNVFKAGAQIVPLSLMPKPVQINRLRKQIADAQEDPQTFAQNLQNNHLGYYFPDHAAAIGQTVANNVAYLNQIKPNIQKALPLDKDRTPSNADETKFHNALMLAEQPMFGLQKVKDGTFTSEDANHLMTMYPSFYNESKMKLAQSLTDHLTKGGSIPPQMRLPLSIYLGQPMDSTMTPQNIMSAQPQIPGQQQVAQQPNGQKVTKHASEALGKIPNQFRTQTQARQKDTVSKE